MSQTSLSARIKQIMNESGMTTTEFSNKLGVQRSGLSHVFNGRNRPGLDLVLRIVKVFPQVSYEWLLEGKETKRENVTSGSDHDKTEDAAQFDVTTVTENNNNTRSELSEAASKESEDVNNVSKEEEQAEYRTLSHEDKGVVNKSVEKKHSSKKAIRIIVLYSDGSFESFHS